MKKIAAVNIKNNTCVKFSRNNEFDIYHHHPIEFCKNLKSKGIDKIHIVDIDGVYNGHSTIYELLKSILQEVSIPIQFGGGIRSYKTAQAIAELGIDLVLGTAAISNQELLIALLEEYPDKIIVAADVYEDLVYTEGWEENSSIKLIDFMHTLDLLQVKKVMITDISRSDNQDNYENISKKFNHIEFILAADTYTDSHSNLSGIVIQGENL